MDRCAYSTKRYSASTGRNPMGMQLNIKSDDAYRLAARLAELTGESLTATVTTALRERLEREEQARDREEQKQRLLEITADIRRHMRHPLPFSDHGWVYSDHGWVYDEVLGLPK
jgi:antitoxin VapB